MFNMRRLLDRLAMVLGVWLLFTTLYFRFVGDHKVAMTTIAMFSIVFMVSAFIGEEGKVGSTPELLNAILAVMLFLSPWLLMYSDDMAASWNAWVVSILMIFLEMLAMPHGMMDRTPHTPG